MSNEFGFAPPINAQTIEGIVRYRKSMSAEDVAEALFGNRGRVSDVRKDLNWLVETAKYWGRDLDGRYFPVREGPSELNANEFVRLWSNGSEN